jgi:hypothetical protein
MSDVLRINPATVLVTIRVTVQAFNHLIGRVIFHLHYQPNNPRVDPADSRQLNQLYSQLLDHRKNRPRKSQLNVTMGLNIIFAITNGVVPVIL